MKFLSAYSYECPDCGRGPMWWERLSMRNQDVSRRWYELFRPRLRRERKLRAAEWAERVVWPIAGSYVDVYRRAAELNCYALASDGYKKGTTYEFPHIESLRPFTTIPSETIESLVEQQ